VCLFGDFMQTLTVNLCASRAEVIGAYLKKSRLSRYVCGLRLIENMRLRCRTLSGYGRMRNVAFAQRLLTVGESTGKDDMIDWPSKHVVKSNPVPSTPICSTKF
jgi:hypothetical protein